MKIKKGDNVQIIAGKDKGRKGKILLVDKKKSRVIVEGAGMIVKHQKPGRGSQNGGLIKKEAFLDSSNVMYLHKGKPTRIGYIIEKQERDGKSVNVKKRVAKTTGEVID